MSDNGQFMSKSDTRDGPRSALLVASSGGHLTQLVSLQPWWRTRDRVWVTFATEDARSRLKDERVFWAYRPTTRNLVNLVRNLGLALRVFREARPDVVVSNGAGVAFPFFVVARVLGVPTVYVEVFGRLDSPTLTGRLCRPFSTLFLAQWEEQLQFYPKAVVIGRLL